MHFSGKEYSLRVSHSTFQCSGTRKVEKDKVQDVLTVGNIELVTDHFIMIVHSSEEVWNVIIDILIKAAFRGKFILRTAWKVKTSDCEKALEILWASWRYSIRKQLASYYKKWMCFVKTSRLIHLNTRSFVISDTEWSAMNTFIPEMINSYLVFCVCYNHNPVL